MRHAARQPEEEPAPDRAGLEAKADLALAGQRAADAEIRAVSAEIRDALRLLPAAACDERLAVMLAGRLALLAGRLEVVAVASFDSGTHLYETRAEMARYAAANAGGDSFFDLGRAYERSLQDAAAKAAVPGPRHARGAARYRPGEGQRALFSVKLSAFAALAWAGLRHAWTAHKLATAATGLVATAGLTAAVTIGPASLMPHGGSYNGQGPAPAASVYAAAPLPSSSPAALLLTKPKPKHAARGKTLLSAASGMPGPVYFPGRSSSSSPSSSPSPAVSVQVAGTLVVSPQSINLATALTGTATVRIRAWGGDASWSVQSVPPDLTLTFPDGTQVIPGQSYDLPQGQSVDLTVGLALYLDGSTLVTFTVGSVTVQVTVPLPVPVPTVPVSIPPVVPSVLPS